MQSPSPSRRTGAQQQPPQAPSTASSPALGVRALLASGLQPEGVVGRMPGLKADTNQNCVLELE
jgi:hypothetical protein